MSSAGCGCVPALFRRENHSRDRPKKKKKKKNGDLPKEDIGLQVTPDTANQEQDLMDNQCPMIIETYDEEKTARMSSRQHCLKKQRTMADDPEEVEKGSEEEFNKEKTVMEDNVIISYPDNEPEHTDDESSTGSTNTGSTTIAVGTRQSDSSKLSSPDHHEISPHDENEVWSPSTQKRSLRLDFSQLKNQSEENISTSGKGSPGQSARESSEVTGEPSPSVWQPFGAPADTPQFRSVKLEALSPKAQPSQSKTPPQSTSPPVAVAEEQQPTSPPAQQNEKGPPENVTDENAAVEQTVEEKVEDVVEEKPSAEAQNDTKPKSVAPTTTTTTSFTRGGRITNLPPSQSPTITLLQKAREGQIPKGAIYIDERSDSRDAQIPRNAILVDQKVTVEGDKVHTDSYYAVPTTIATGEVTTHILKAPKYDGIGPTEYGIPVGLRTGVKDEYASDWYKTMYRSLHKTAEDSRGRTQTVHLGGYMSEPEYDRKTSYQPDYATVDYQRRPDKYFVSRDTRGGAKSPEYLGAKISDDLMSDGILSSRHHDSYKNQPRSIAEYEPGHSSLADREFQKFWDDFWESLDDLNEHFRHSPRPQRSYEKKWPNAILCDGYESDSTLIRKSVNPPPRIDPEQQKAWYKEIQRGGEIPLTGLRKPAPEKPKESPHHYQETEVNIHYKSPIRNLEKEYIEEEELRKRQEEAMRRFYAEERQKKQLQQAAEIEMRRHSDNFTPSQKSPIPLNRYDNPFETSFTLKPPGSTTDYPRTLAQVLYPFVAQTTRELSLSKGDIVYINRQIDKNWYEGEHHGFVGIFPVSYVAVIPTEKANLQPKKAHEGHAIVKYTFRAKTPIELSLFKGERVILTRRVDQNWYEGRLGTKKGIFPVSYVDVLQEPGDSNLRGDITVSPKPPASPVYSPIVNGNPYKSSSSPTYVSGSASLQKPQVPELKGSDRVSVTQSLHVDTYNEPIPYRCLYSYRPQNDDELELKEGDTVYVMEKCDDGWYVGTSLRTGLFGTFPGNYVERI